MSCGQKKLPKKIFVTGTGTGVGKTIVCAVLMSGIKGKYFKPVQSGLSEPTDTQTVMKMTGLSPKHFHPEIYRLKEPLSPHASSAKEGIRIRLSAMEIPKAAPFEYLVAEGAGGIMVPLNEKHLIADLMKKWNLPVILVAKSGLGTINHTLLSIQQLKRYNIEIFGVVMDGPFNEPNSRAIEHFGQTKVIAQIPVLEKLNPESLIKCFESHFKGFAQ